jgi:hypothetical protein
MMYSTLTKQYHSEFLGLFIDFVIRDHPEYETLYAYRDTFLSHSSGDSGSPGRSLSSQSNSPESTHKKPNPSIQSTLSADRLDEGDSRSSSPSVPSFTCMYEFRRGPRKHERCGKATTSDSDWCTKHRRTQSCTSVLEADLALLEDEVEEEENDDEVETSSHSSFVDVDSDPHEYIMSDDEDDASIEVMGSDMEEDEEGM